MKKYYSKRRKSSKITSSTDTTKPFFKKVKGLVLEEENVPNDVNDFKIDYQDKQIKSKKKKGIKGIIVGSIIGLFAIACIAIFFFFLPYLTIAYNSYQTGFDTSRIDSEKIPKFYDKDGNLILVMYGYDNPGKEGYAPTYSSVYVNVNSLPKYVGNAFISIEDESFYSNNGISFGRLALATVNYVFKGDSSFGGSTITQQLVKVATGDDDHSASRKAREIGHALYLNENWSKEKILASYINLVYFGNGAYGIYEAAHTYFDIEPADLNIAQAAVLAAIPNSPEALNPYNGEENKKNLLNRQKIVLSKMLELKFITEEEYTEAINFEITFTNGSDKITKNNKAINQYINIAFDQVVNLVQDKYYYSREKAIEAIFSQSTIIYLNMDTELQNSVYQSASSLYKDHENFEVGAVMTSKSGQVLAIVGSRTGSQVDHAYYMTRQTGSAIKPVSVYSPAFDLGLVTPDTYLYDGPVSIKSSSGTWRVQNADRSYRGNITIKNAIAYSLNTIAVLTLEKVTLPKSLEYVKSFGITSITENDLYYPALGLGGLTYGVSPYELAQAYNVFNNDGYYSNISTINKVVIDGNTLIPDKNEHQVISHDANEKMKVALSAAASYGTGRTAALSDKASYLKTGTTNSRKDIWTCGFTNEVTTCIWGGYDIPKTTPVSNMNALWKEMVQSYYR